jgi:hypothetical protein
MSQTQNATYTKNGATFSNANEEYADKNSLYGPELSQQVDDCYAQMVTDGVLLEPVGYEWDQATYTLTVLKVISSPAAYTQALTFDTNTCLAASQSAGWTFVQSATV